MTTTDSPAIRVSRGIALLDDQRPGWRSQIDLDTLDLGSCYSCVLGQVFDGDGDYHDGTPWGTGMQVLFGEFDAHEEQEYAAFNNGFDRVPGEDYEVLQRAWVRALTEDVLP